MERLINIVASIRGAKVGFFRGDVNGLIEDMQLIKPPLFIGVPRIFQKIQNRNIFRLNIEMHNHFEQRMSIILCYKSLMCLLFESKCLHFISKCIFFI